MAAGGISSRRPGWVGVTAKDNRTFQRRPVGGAAAPWKAPPGYGIHEKRRRQTFVTKLGLALESWECRFCNAWAPGIVVRAAGEICGPLALWLQVRPRWVRYLVEGLSSKSHVTNHGPGPESGSRIFQVLPDDPDKQGLMIGEVRALGGLSQSGAPSEVRLWAACRERY